ncbi:hypothetical protein [Paraburkholderia tuberum]|uniref:hypothetical protein n=1 Tax=Paraburkholderia tuberum TaxID=157910 RepID=UPI0026AE6CF0
MAADALLMYLENKQTVPTPSEPKVGEEMITRPVSALPKVLLPNEMIAQEVTQSELARRINTRPQDVNRIVDLAHTPKFDIVAAALRAPQLRDTPDPCPSPRCSAGSRQSSRAECTASRAAHAPAT